MAITESNVESAIQALTAFSIQTSAEAGTNPPTNTAANILHASASRNQGNFTFSLAMSETKLTEDLARIGKTATDAEKEKALAYLIADLVEKKDPDWNARSISIEGYSVSRGGYASNGATCTGYMKAYLDLLDSLPLCASGAFSDQDEDGIVQTKDAEDYPGAWRLSGLKTEDSDPF